MDGHLVVGIISNRLGGHFDFLPCPDGALKLFRKKISLLEWPCFVAERRLDLARPFKAGIKEASRVTSRQRRLSEWFSRR